MTKDDILDDIRKNAGAIVAVYVDSTGDFIIQSTEISNSELSMAASIIQRHLMERLGRDSTIWGRIQ